MPRIIPIPWKKFEKFLFYIGCEFQREKGDHRVYSKSNLKRPVVIPREKELPVFIIKNNLRILGVGNEEYIEIIHKL